MGKKHQEDRVYRVYTGAEMYADRAEPAEGPHVMVGMRLLATEVSSKGHTEWATPFLAFTPETLASLGQQLLEVAARCQKWREEGGEIDLNTTAASGLDAALVPLDPKKAN
jgi:hypothetical protein